MLLLISFILSTVKVVRDSDITCKVNGLTPHTVPLSDEGNSGGGGDVALLHSGHVGMDSGGGILHVHCTHPRYEHLLQTHAAQDVALRLG